MKLTDTEKKVLLLHYLGNLSYVAENELYADATRAELVKEVFDDIEITFRLIEGDMRKIRALIEEINDND